MDYLTALLPELREELTLYCDEARIEVGMPHKLDEPVYSLTFTFRGRLASPPIYCTLDGIDRFLRGTCLNLGAFDKPIAMHWLIRHDRAMVIRARSYRRNHDFIDISEDLANIVLIKLRRIYRILIDKPRPIVI